MFKNFRIIFIAALLIVGVSACTKPDKTVEVLKAQGYKDIQITGYRWTGCGDDQFHTGFTATSTNGTYVEGVVCSGWLKGATVRFD